MVGEGIEAIGLYQIQTPNHEMRFGAMSFRKKTYTLLFTSRKSEPFRGDVTYVTTQLTLAPSNQKGCEGTSEIDFVGGRGGRMFFVVSLVGPPATISRSDSENDSRRGTSLPLGKFFPPLGAEVVREVMS